MTSPKWTRAIFLREPRERFLSAYLDKAVRNSGKFVQVHCCHHRRRRVVFWNPQKCVNAARKSLQGFLTLTKSCQDTHWLPQVERMDAKYWPYINFVGKLDTAAQDTKRLLQKIGAWESFGATGWGESGKEAIFQSASNIRHKTDAKLNLDAYYTRDVERAVRKTYADDFELYAAAVG
jgi:ribosomal protein S27E